MQIDKKKKADYAALNSPFMRIAKMNVRAARALLDLGFKEVYELRGRSAQSIFEDLKKIKLNPDSDLEKYFELAINFAENQE